MDRVFFFEFESRAWSCRMCAELLPPWTFGHATKRGRSIFAFGSSQGDTGTLEVGRPRRACSRGSAVIDGLLSEERIHDRDMIQEAVDVALEADDRGHFTNTVR